MSKINVDTWEPESGTAATLMASGDTVTLPSGAILSVASGGDINVASGGEIDIASGATLDVNGTIDVTGATVTGLTTGSLVKLLSTTLSGASAGVAFDSTYITSTYDNYYVLVNGFLPVTDNADIGIYLSVDDGVTFATHLSGNFYLALNSTGYGWAGSQNAHYIAHDCSNVVGEMKVNGWAIIQNVNDTTCYKSIYGNGSTQNSGTKADDYAYNSFTSFASLSAVNYMIIKSNSGNLQGFGTATLYGVVK